MGGIGTLVSIPHHFGSMSLLIYFISQFSSSCLAPAMDAEELMADWALD
jgi:hypothetical protein